MMRIAVLLTLTIQIQLVGKSLGLDRCGSNREGPLYCTYGHHCCSNLTGHCCVDADVCTPRDNGCISIGLLVTAVVVGVVFLLIITICVVKAISVLSKKRVHPDVARLPPKARKFKPDPKYPRIDD